MRLRTINNHFTWIIVLFVSVMIAGIMTIPDFWDRTTRLVATLNVFFLLLAFLMTLFHFFMEPLRWRLYLQRKEGGEGLTYRKLLYVFSVTALVTYVFPAKLGLPVRMLLLKSQMHLGLAQITTVMGVDGVLSYLIWGTPAVIYFFSGQEWSFRKELILYPVVIAILALALFLLRRRLGKIIALLRDHFFLIRRRSILYCGFLFLLDIAGYTLRHAFLLYAAGARMDMVKLALITTFSIFAGFLSMIPMGIGAYDASLIYLLTQQGISYEIALMVPVINRTGNILASLVLGVPSSYAIGVSFLSLKREANAVE